jgi:hypothetical protein
MSDTNAASNTDKELWRYDTEDEWSDSIHVTENGGIGINCGGHVIVLPIRAWHELAVKDAMPATRHTK